MKQALVLGLPWLISVMTLAFTWLAGDKNRNTWVVGLINQVLWLVWILVDGAWGLLPMNAALWVIYYRNHRRWKENK